MHKIIKRNSNDQNDRWNYWSAHRQALSNIIKEKIIKSHKNSDNIAIFGAGQCNDLDLKSMLLDFKEVYLFDKNKNDIELGIEQQKLSIEQRNKVTIIGDFDFTGISNTFYDELENLLSMKARYKKIVKFIRDEASNLKGPEELEHLTNKFSAVVSSTVHSQLCIDSIKLLNKYCLDYETNSVNKIYDEIRYLYLSAVKIYNDLCLSVIKPDGTLMMAFDLIEVSRIRGSLHLFPIIQVAISKGNPAPIMSLANDYGITGSVEGHKDILLRVDDNLSDGSIEDLVNQKKLFNNFWLWHYFDEMIYYVSALTIHMSCLDCNSK